MHTNTRRMKKFYCLITFMLALAATGCNSTRDITRRAGSRTDYIPGEIYELQQPLFLFKHDKQDSEEIPVLVRLGFGGTPKNLADFQKSAPLHPQVAGVLLEGDQIQVTKLVESRSFEIGNILHVYAIILTGEPRGEVVDLFLLSKEGPSHYYAFIDLDILKPLNKL